MSRSINSFFIDSLGCAKNQVDSEIYIHHLNSLGLKRVLSPDEADLIIVNSCGFIRDAQEESIRTLFTHTSEYPDTPVVLAGCLPERLNEKEKRKLPELAGIVGNRRITDLADFVHGMLREQTEGSAEYPAHPHRDTLLSYPGSTYIKLAEGCNNGCSYCAIPLIRGGLRSRRQEDIVNEILHFVDRGIFEIVLIAQDLGAYGADLEETGGLPGLLRAVSGIKGDFWIRMLYIHPDHFPLEILDICLDDPRILPYFDVPFQHASTALLRKMGRSGTSEEYLSLIRLIRAKLPRAVIRTTMMVGFPGETEEDFLQLLRFQEEGRFDWLGAFVYSREKGTAAYDMTSGPAVRRQAKRNERRKAQIQEKQQKITDEMLRRFVGSTQRVLIEEEIQGENLFLGRGYLQAPDVDGLMVVKGKDLKPGDIVTVRVTRLVGVDLEAETVS